MAEKLFPDPFMKKKKKKNLEYTWISRLKL